MSLVRALITAGLSLAATAVPALAQLDVPECGTTGPVLWFWWHHHPEQIDHAVQLTGLRPDETIGAIDFNPDTGVLYGAGNHGGFYTIDMGTGQAQLMGSVGFDIEFPCGNDLKWIRRCPGCPPPPPPWWEFVLPGGERLRVALDPAGLGVQIAPALRFPASSQYAGITPNITGLAALPAAGPQPSPWDLYAYDAVTCGLYKVDQLADLLIDLDWIIHPGCWPPDGSGGVIGMDALDGPRPHPWISFTYPVGDSTGLAVLDTDIPGAQAQPLGLIGGGGLRILDSTILSVSCPADLNGDGLIDFADYLEFLNLYEAGDPRVDFNGDGQVDFADYLEFLNYYDAGC